MTAPTTVDATATLTAGAEPAARASGGLRGADLLMLAVVAVVVCIVSLPRLEAYALAKNESDARLTLAILARELLAPEAVSSSNAAQTLGAAVAASDPLRHRLRDMRPTERPDVMLHHGYHLALVREGRETRFFAWPRTGRTGHAVFAWSGGELWGLPDPGPAWLAPLDKRSLEGVEPSTDRGWLVLAR